MVLSVVHPEWLRILLLVVLCIIAIVIIIWFGLYSWRDLKTNQFEKHVLEVEKEQREKEKKARENRRQKSLSTMEVHFFVENHDKLMEKYVTVMATNLVSASRQFVETNGVPAMLVDVRDKLGRPPRVEVEVDGILRPISLNDPGILISQLDALEDSFHAHQEYCVRMYKKIEYVLDKIVDIDETLASRVEYLELAQTLDDNVEDKGKI